MKNLIEHQLIPNKSNNPQIHQKSSSFSKIQHIASVFSASVNKNNHLSTPHPFNNQSLTKSNLFLSNQNNQRLGQQINGNSLKQKYNQQQVSSLYSEHIYKSFQRDYIHEAQIQKYKMMLNNQKKQKMKLLAEKNQWKIQRTKLLEQKQVILFALDSMTVKLDPDPSNKKSKQLRRQTAQILKSKFYSSESNQQNKDQFQFKQDQCNQNRLTDQGKNNQTFDKLNKIKFMKQNVNRKNLFQLKQKLDKKIDQQQEIEQEVQVLQVQYQQTEMKVQQLQAKNSQFKQIIVQKQQKILEVLQKLEQNKKQNQQLIIRVEKIQQKNKNADIKLQEYKAQIQKLTNQKQKIKQRVTELQKQLKITQQEYKTRENRQKQCVKILQRFSQDLKLSDDKINEFLKNQVSSYSQENNNDVSRTKKTYNEHLSYILHLCKKKQALYENLVQQFKDKVKQSEFLLSMLEKKLSNFTQYQQRLRELVSTDSDRNTIIKTIVKFGY